MDARTGWSRREILALAGTLPFAGHLAHAATTGSAAVAGRAAASTLPVGLELYSVRDALKADLMGTVRAVAKLGYQVVEFYSPYLSWTPQMASDVKKLLDDLGIRALSTHNSADVFTADGLQKAIDLNRAIGSKCIVMASAGKVVSADDWKGVADRLNAAADKLTPLGMSTGFHNHAIEWKPVDGGLRPMDILAKNTRKEVVLQLDLGTCVEAGVDPVAWIHANPGRIKSLHCKDWSKANGYSVLFGEGEVPWTKVFEAAESTGGAEFYLIEQEEGPVPEQLQRAERCIANWKKIKR
jgi:sugar phosphate isomerase/epimerase